jgi:hypothetical protein
VFDMGAGHTVYEDPALFERVRLALAPFRNVVLLLPSENVEQSLELMEGYDPVLARDRAINRHFIEHPSNGLLARYTVYWHGLTPEQTRDEVLRATGLSDAALT